MEHLNRFTLTCGCGFKASFDDEDRAESAAKSHIVLGTGHAVTCTRPAHFHPGSVPVIVFIANIEKHPHLMK